MDDSSMFMQWALDMLQHEHPAAAGVDDYAETTFPSLRALRDASLVMDAHAVNSSGSGDTDGSGGSSSSTALAAMEHELSPPTPYTARSAPTNGRTNLPVTSWNFRAVSAQPDIDVHGKFDVLARPMRRIFRKSSPAPYPQDHIIAERKRRENMNRRFIELSAVIPGLKKMDKATILSDATAHIKELHEKLKAVETASGHGRRIETAVLAHKPNKNIPSCSRRTRLQEIEARLSESSVMVRIHCANEKGVVVKLLTEMEESLHLSLTNTAVTPFTAGTVIITIVATVEEDCIVTAEFIRERLNCVLQQF